MGTTTGRGSRWLIAAQVASLCACSGTGLTVGDAAAPRDVGSTADAPAADAPVAPACLSGHAADILFVVDNSNTMYDNNVNFTRSFGALLTALVDGDAATAITDLHVGVVTTDLGTPGSTVPSCAQSDLGDDGQLNPTRRGPATQTHQAWYIARPGVRPARCMNIPDQYPPFLSYGAADGAAGFAEDFTCVATLFGGCGLEQPLEAAYRALVVHGASAAAGVSAPNAGFVRPQAMLGIFVLTDEEDGSTRDCRYAEPGAPCDDATSVFDQASARWASPDLNLRFYLYAPGSPQDPTWPLARYIDPTNPSRGYPSLKPGHPERVVFGAVSGVPLELPRRADGGVAWASLLGDAADGSDGYVGMSAEGPVSMRHANRDANCATRVVPACRREGSAYDPSRPVCDTAQQYFAWPSRRVATVARRFDERYGNGVIGSICRNDDAPTLRALAARLRAGLCR